MKTPLFLSTCLLLASCNTPSTKTLTLPEGLSTIDATAPIACQFEKKLTGSDKPQSTSWYFWRENQRTESRDEVSNQGEIWERNKNGQVSYTRLFYKDRIALESTPGDLAAAQNAIPWEQLTSLIDTGKLGKELILKSKDSINKTTIEYYEGSINGVTTEVAWLPAIKLPARIVKKRPDQSYTLTLAKCGNQAKQALPQISQFELENFRHLDYTDLGDMENDPTVRHIQQLIGGHQQHG
ncbi:MAG: hypothetical protein ABL933_18290 [Methyloglobulus sp.]|nr:hypothetical protein [Methyloglobulus sp.]